MDDFTEKRFSYLKNKSIEELEAIKKETLEDTEYLLKKLEDKTTSSEFRSEIENSDLKLNRDILEYIETLLPHPKKK